MNIDKHLTGTEFENLIPKFHEEGIITVEDLVILHKNAKVFDLCKKITNTSADAMKLNKLINEMFAKRARKIGIIVSFFVAGPFFIFLIVMFKACGAI